MNSKVYDVLKRIQRIVLPALLTMYVTIATALGWGNIEVISAIVGAVITFLGAILEIDNVSYTKKQNTFSDSFDNGATDSNGHED